MPRNPPLAERFLYGLVLFHTTNWTFRSPNGIRRLKLEKAPQGLISAPEGAFQLQTGVSNPRTTEERMSYGYR